MPEAGRLGSTLAMAGLVLAATGLLLCSRGFAFPSDNNIPNIVGDLVQIDPDLFHHDPFARDRAGFGPRTAFHLVLGTAQSLGLPAVAVYTGGYVVALLALVAALLALAGQALGPVRRDLAWAVATGAFLLWVVHSDDHLNLGTTRLWKQELVSQGLATPLVVAAWAAAWSGRWAVAGILVGCAAPCQILVAAYAGALLAVFAVARHGLVGALAPLLRFSLPALAGGLGTVLGTVARDHGSSLADRDFIAAYAGIRVPHHVRPTIWPWSEWVETVALYLATGLLLWSWPQTRRWTWPWGLAAGGGLALIVVAGWLVEQGVPLAAKAQPARLTPLLLLAVLVVLLVATWRAGRRREWVLVGLLVSAPLSQFAGLLLCAAPLVSGRAGRRLRRRLPALVALALGALPALLLGLLVRPPGSIVIGGVAPYGFEVVSTAFAGLLLGLLVVAWSRWRWQVRVLLLAACLALPAIGLERAQRQGWTPPWWNHCFAGFRLHVPVRPETLAVATVARERLPRDAIVLADPFTIESDLFRMLAQRSVYVTWKAVPFSSPTLAEWYERLSRFLEWDGSPGDYRWHGHRLVDYHDQALATLAEDLGVDHLLLWRSAPDLGWNVAAESGDLHLYARPVEGR